MSLTKSDLSNIDKIVGKKLKPIEKRLISIEKGVKENYKNTNMVIDFFDREYLRLRAEIERIKKYIDMPPLTV